jgi:phage replication-related protein YjqB (UPF0714/DUF867 family)
VADAYANYADLASHQTEGVDYERRQAPVTGATWVALSIHGGGIEPGSGEAARATAAGLMNHYEFAGLKSSGNSVLHITSTHFDEPTALGIVTAAKRCISFHGYQGAPGVAETSLGGLDKTAKARVSAALRDAGFRVVAGSQELNGDDPANVANKTTISAGVQLEMSNALRASFFPNGDLSRAMRDSGQRTAAFNAYVAAVRSAFDGQGRMSCGSVNVSRWATVLWPSAEVDIKARMATDALASGGSHFVHLAGRVVDTNTNYLARLAFNTDQTVTLTLRSRIGGTETLLATAADTSFLAHAASRMFWLRFAISGTTLQAKAWQDGAYEPPWMVSATDNNISAAGQVGIRAILSSTNTNTLPVTASFDDFQQVTPQTFSVIRSVNGVVKSHAAGEDVRLAHPTYMAL